MASSTRTVRRTRKSAAAPARKPKAKAESLRSNTPEFKPTTKAGRKAAAHAAKQEAPSNGRTRKAPADPHAGLRGEALAAAKEGTSLREQMQSARQRREYEAALSAAPNTIKSNSKETSMKRNTKTHGQHIGEQRTRARKGTVADTPAPARKRTSERQPRAAQPTGKHSPADIAKQAKVTPLEVRKALRSQSRIKKGPEGWLLTAKQAEAIVKALKA